MRYVRREVMSFICALIRMWQVFIPNKEKENYDVEIPNLNYNASSDYQ